MTGLSLVLTRSEKKRGPWLLLVGMSFEDQPCHREGLGAVFLVDHRGAR